MIDLADHRRIHCIGIGGIGVSAIAEILLSRGYYVSGSDLKESDIIDKLKAIGATVYKDHRASNIKDADLVIYSAAIPDDNPEIIEAKKKNIKIASRAEILGVLMDEYENSIAVSGTHGKTTTTSMISLVLAEGEMDPTVLVGGTLNEIHGNYRVGKSDYFVAEACEYKDSFLNLKPKVEIILNIDNDHLDYFENINSIIASFKEFTSNIKEDGLLLVYDDNPNVDEVIKDINGTVKFGFKPESDYRAGDISFTENGFPEFTVYYGENKKNHMVLSVPGRHNIINALAAFSCCCELGMDPEMVAKTLELYKGTDRRFEYSGKTGRGAYLVDDYAHHPTEIKATLSAAFHIPHKKIWCIFQPHTYERVAKLFDDFVDSFELADVLIITETYVARGSGLHTLSSEDLARAIGEKYPEKELCYMADFDKIAEKIRSEAGPGDIVMTMGAGDVNKIIDKVRE